MPPRRKNQEEQSRLKASTSTSPDELVLVAPDAVSVVNTTSIAADPMKWVEDHGDGIPPSEHEKIFERFYRPGSELRRQTQGVGIGLSIVKHIVEAHGGRVLVRSAVGQGSRFTIELPLSSMPPKSETRNPKAE